MSVWKVVITVVILSCGLFTSQNLLADESVCSGFFCADNTAYPLVDEIITFISVEEPFMALSTSPNTLEDCWLIHPANSQFIVIDIGSQVDEQTTSVIKETIFQYLIMHQPPWFVFLHPHLSGTSRNPSSVDLAFLWEIEIGLDQHDITIPFTAVIVFDKGYFIYQLNDKIRDYFSSISNSSQYEGSISGWMDFQIEWDLILANDYNMTTEDADIDDYIESAKEYINIEYAKTTAQMIPIIYKFLGSTQ